MINMYVRFTGISVRSAAHAPSINETHLEQECDTLLPDNNIQTGKEWHSEGLREDRDDVCRTIL